MALTPPVGYRPARDSDIAVGKDVVYVSRAPGRKEVRARVEDAVVIQDDQLGPCIRLEAKRLAQMSKCPLQLSAIKDHHCTAYSVCLLPRSGKQRLLMLHEDNARVCYAVLCVFATTILGHEQLCLAYSTHAPKWKRQWL